MRGAWRRTIAIAAVLCGCHGSPHGSPPGHGDAGPIVLSAEFPIGAPVRSPADDARDPAVGAAGSGFLVAFVEGNQGDRRIRAVRVALDGQLVDSVPIDVGTSMFAQMSPAVACAPTECLVVWGQDTAPEPGSGIDLRAARVGMDGVALDSATIHVADGASWTATIAVGWDGANFVVVRSTGNGMGQVLSQRIAEDGTVLDPSPAIIFNAMGFNGFLRVGCGASGCLAAWDVNDPSLGIEETRAARLAPDGTALDLEGFTVNGLQGPQSIAGGASGWVLLGNIQYGVGAVRIDPNGTRLDPVPLTVFDAGTGGSGNFGDSKAAFDGATWLVVTQEVDTLGSPATSRMVAKRLAADGTIAGPSFSVVPAYPQGDIPGAACAPASCLVASTVYGSSGTDVVVGRVQGQSAPDAADGILVTLGANREWLPTAASDGDGFLVAYEDDREGSTEIRAVRITSGGAAQAADADGILVGRPIEMQAPPEAGFDGANFHVVWFDGPRGLIETARVSPDGALLDDPPVTVFDEGQPGFGLAPGMGCGAGTCLVTWQAGDEQVARFVGQDGALLGTAPTNLGPSTNGSVPRSAGVVWSGGVYSVTWTGNMGGAMLPIEVARVRADRTAVDASPVGVSDPMIGFAAGGAPRLAASGDGVLVSWAGFGDNSSQAGVRVRGADGAFAGPLALLPVDGAYPFFTTPSWDGALDVVAWQELDASGLSRLDAARVAADGAVLDAHAFRVTDDDVSGGAYPAVASNATGATLFVWTIFDPAPEMHTLRLRARVLQR